MALSRLAMEFVLIDGGSVVAKRVAQSLRDIGTEGRAAADHIDTMVDRWNDGLKLLGTARTLKDVLLTPGLQAAGSLQDALKRLEVTLDKGSVAETQKILDEMGADAARVAGPTKFSQEQMLDVQTELLKAGIDRTSIIGAGGASEAVARLGTAEGMSAEQALGAVLALGGTFRLAGNQYAAAADDLVRAGGAATIGPLEIQEALKMVAGAAKMDRLEVLAALGAAGTVGLKGTMGGTAMSNFLMAAAKQDKKHSLQLFNDAGELKALPEVAKQLRAKFGGLSTQEQLDKLPKIFGEEGARFARALMLEGNGSIEDVLAKMGSARGLDDRTAILSSSYNAQVEALKGSLTTLLATMFQPALSPLASATSDLNDAAAALTAFGQENPELAKIVTGSAMVATSGAALLGAVRMAQGGASGLAALREMGKLGGLKSLLGTAGGVAAGKAVEAATGVTPVYVTNWPDGSGMGAPGAGGGAAVPAAAAGAGAAASGASRAGPYALAALAGITTGLALNEFAIKDTQLETILQGALANAMLWSPVRMALSDMQIEGMGEVRRKGINAAKSAVGLKVDVHIDRDNNATVTTRSDDGAVTRAASRTLGGG